MFPKAKPVRKILLAPASGKLRKERKLENKDRHGLGVGGDHYLEVGHHGLEGHRVLSWRGQLDR